MQPRHQIEEAVAPTGVADILLVEDDAIDADLVLRALRKSGLGGRVEHVSDGVQALEYIAASTLFAQKNLPSMPKVILLDLNLGKLGGLHVLRQLKADDRTRSIPIVVLTSSHMAIELLESYKLGVNSYVIKPDNADRFAEVVAEIGQYWLSINEVPPG